jgi:hypothetical protein
MLVYACICLCREAKASLKASLSATDTGSSREGIDDIPVQLHALSKVGAHTEYI